MPWGKKFGWTVSFIKFVSRNMAVTLFLLLLLVTAIRNPLFLTLQNFANILANIPTPLCMALGLSLVMIAGDFDLSFAACSEITAAAIVAFPASNSVILASLAAVLVFSLLNSLGVVFLDVHPWIVTIGTMLMALGGAEILTGARQLTFSQHLVKVLGENFGNFGSLSVFISLLLALLVAIFVHRTRYGLALYAVGGSRDVAYREGIKVRWYRVLSYLLAGVLYWFGGISYLASTGMFRAGQIQLQLLDVILAVFISMSLSRRRIINIPGVIVGVVFVAVLSNIILMLNIPSFWVSLFKGLVALVIISGAAMGSKDVVQLE